jgi:hypothetical protein
MIVAWVVRCSLPDPGRAPLRVSGFLDNQSVVRVYTDCETRLIQTSVDVWDDIRYYKRAFQEVGVSYELEWRRGHPERTKGPDPAGWDNLDRLNHAADGLADVGRLSPGGPLEGGVPLLQHARRWRVSYAGKRVVDLGRADVLLSALGLGRLLSYEVEDGSDPAVPRMGYPHLTRLFARPKSVISRAESLKFMWGQLATLRRVSDWKGQRPPPGSLRCRACGAEEECLMHVVVSCRSRAVVAARRRFYESCGRAVLRLTEGLPGPSAASLADKFRRALTLLDDGRIVSGTGDLAYTRSYRILTGHFTPEFAALVADFDSSVASGAAKFLRRFRTECATKLWWPAWQACRAADVSDGAGGS